MRPYRRSLDVAPITQKPVAIGRKIRSAAAASARATGSSFEDRLRMGSRQGRRSGPTIQSHPQGVVNGGRAVIVAEQIGGPSWGEHISQSHGVGGQYVQ